MCCLFAYDEAIVLARRGTRRDPKDGEAWLVLGAAYDAIGNHLAARDAYTNCVKQAIGPRMAECSALLQR